MEQPLTLNSFLTSNLKKAHVLTIVTYPPLVALYVPTVHRLLSYSGKQADCSKDQTYKLSLKACVKDHVS